MKLEAGWVPVALSSSIEAATSAGAVVEGSEIVVWRDNSGVVHVWEDRCPHRGMRMSFGFVRGDHIACLYHGWQYDAGGQCRYIPAHPTLDVPSTIKVPTYVSEEKYGIVWATASPDAAMPDIGPVVEMTPVRSLYVDCSAADAISALDAEGLEHISTDTGLLACDGDKLFIAVQAITATKAAVHAVLLGPPSADNAKRQAHHARRLEKMRYALEQAAEFA